MKAQRIAVIGAGTAGLATAIFLQNSGHHVTLFEKFDAPKPLGAGLLLQPTGLAVLSLLGLDKHIIESGSIIRKLHGRVSGSRIATLDVAYSDFAPHLFGVGIQRGSLFSALYQKTLQAGVTIQAAQEITDIKPQANKAEVINKRGDVIGAYDLVVDACGTKSILRQKYANVKLDKPYPYGAIWSVAKLTDKFQPDVLEQRYKNAYHMIGVLPVGKVGAETADCAAFFWSMRVADYPAWRAQPFSQWQDYVAGLWPETDALLRQFQNHDDLTFAHYSDVILRKYHNDNIVFIGDSAHCTSPQLGQGANMALVDALILSHCLNQATTLEEALSHYTQRRKNHLRFYQIASRVLTPFFQSDSYFFAKLRFLTCGLACKIPFTRRIAASVLTGTKTGIFSVLNPGDWSPNYDLFNTAHSV